MLYNIITCSHHCALGPKGARWNAQGAGLHCLVPLDTVDPLPCIPDIAFCVPRPTFLYPWAQGHDNLRRFGMQQEAWRLQSTTRSGSTLLALTQHPFLFPTNPCPSFNVMSVKVTRRGDISPGMGFGPALHGPWGQCHRPPQLERKPALQCTERPSHLPAPLALNELLSPCVVARAASNLFPAGSKALLSIPIELSLMGFNFNLLLLENTDGDPLFPPARTYTG